MIKLSNLPISDQGGNLSEVVLDSLLSGLVCFQVWFAFDNDTFFMADNHLLSKENSCHRIEGKVS